MKSWRLWMIPVVLGAWLMLGAAPGQATGYTWNYAGDGNWSDAAKWTPLGGPPSSGSDTAWVDNNLGANVTVSVNGNYTVNKLKIDTGDAVSVDNISPSSMYFHLGGTSATPVLDVAGTFTLNSSGSNTYLQADYASTIQGGGTVVLSGADARISGGTITLALGTTIQGQGYIERSLINNGAVIATGSGLNLGLGGYGITNSGTMTANGGRLNFGGVSGVDPYTTVTNNGTIQNNANTDTLSFTNQSTITTTLGTIGHLDPKGGTVLWNVTDLWDHQVGAGTVQMSGANTFYGKNTLDSNTHITLANGGTLTFIDRNYGNHATLIGGDVTLDSGSTTTFQAGHALSLQSNLFLNGANAKVGGTTITLAAGKTIQGQGLIELNSGHMENQGTITAQGGTLAVHNGWLTGNGTLAITDGSTLDLQYVYGQTHQTGYLTMAQGSNLKVYSDSTVGLSKDFVFAQTDPSTNWNWGTGTTLAMNGTVGGYGQRLEIGGEDYGYDGSTGFDSNTNFNLKNLRIGDTSSSTQTLTFLSDWIDNGHQGGSGGEAEALYVDSLFVGAGDTLNLDNLHLYVKGYGLVTPGAWGSGTISNELVPIPLPSTVLLLGSGLLGLGGWRARLRKS